jgi:carboxypeptidase D
MYGSPDSLGIDAARRSLDHSALVTRGGALRDDGAIRLAERSLSDAERLARRTLGQRSIAGRPNGTIDPFYECSVWDEMWDYAVNFTAPWSTHASPSGFVRLRAQDELTPSRPGRV